MSSSKGLLTYTELGNKNGPFLFLLHGWPDRGSLDTFKFQIDSLIGKYHIVACNLPGYEPAELKSALNPALPFWGYDLTQVADMFYNTIKKFIPKLDSKDITKAEKPNILCHDFGAVVTAIAARKHPNFANKIAYMDVCPEQPKPSAFALLLILTYQIVNIVLFLFPSFIGSPCSRVVAKLLNAPNPAAVDNTMAYLYLRLYAGMITGNRPNLSLPRDKQDPFPEYSDTSIFFAFGKDKPFFFHSGRFVDYVQNKNKGGEVVAFEKDHWFFLRKKNVEGVNDAINKFLVK
jgi:pimeloyl-ACP methyl ester carboxylesterase